MTHKKILALIVLDQITKLIFSGRDFFVGPLHVHLVKNYGLIFSLNFGTLVNLIIIAAALIFFLGYYFFHHAQASWPGRAEFALILAGAISNIFDRLYLGFVRDFLDLGLGFTFNLADAMIMAGLLIVFLFNSPIVRSAPTARID